MKLTTKEVGILLALVEREQGQDVEEFGTMDELAPLMTLGLISDLGEITEKGVAYIGALLSVPLPVQRWVVDPAIAEAVVEFQLRAERALVADKPKGKKRGNRT